MSGKSPRPDLIRLLSHGKDIKFHFDRVGKC